MALVPCSQHEGFNFHEINEKAKYISKTPINDNCINVFMFYLILFDLILFDVIHLAVGE